MAGLVLVILHEVFAYAAARSPRFSVLTQGKPERLAKDGRPGWKAVRRNHLSETNFDESLREAANLADPAQAETVTMERNGSVTLVKRRRTGIVDVDVRDGGQTVRLIVDS